MDFLDALLFKLFLLIIEFISTVLPFVPVFCVSVDTVRQRWAVPERAWRGLCCCVNAQCLLN